MKEYMEASRPIRVQKADQWEASVRPDRGIVGNMLPTVQRLIGPSRTVVQPGHLSYAYAARSGVEIISIRSSNV